MLVSYSRVDTYHTCPYKYKLRYLDKLETKPDTRPTNPLYLGTSIHTGIETRSIEEAVNSYKENYSIWLRDNEVEVLKLETILPVAFKEIPEGEYEHKLLIDDFIGFIDLLVKIDDTTYDLYDFKYSNNVEHYMQSGQVHLYKYYYEKATGNTIRNMYYALVPKCTDTLKTKSEIQLRESIEKLKDSHIQFIPIEFDPQQVAFFLAHKKLMLNATEFPKKQNKLCYFCEYRRFCETNGADTSELKKKQIVEDKKEEHVEEISLW